MAKRGAPSKPSGQRATNARQPNQFTYAVVPTSKRGPAAPVVRGLTRRDAQRAVKDRAQRPSTRRGLGGGSYRAVKDTTAAAAIKRGPGTLAEAKRQEAAARASSRRSSASSRGR